MNGSLPEEERADSAATSGGIDCPFEASAEMSDLNAPRGIHVLQPCVSTEELVVIEAPLRRDAAGLMSQSCTPERSDPRLRMMRVSSALTPSGTSGRDGLLLRRHCLEDFEPVPCSAYRIPDAQLADDNATVVGITHSASSVADLTGLVVDRFRGIH